MPTRAMIRSSEGKTQQRFPRKPIMAKASDGACGHNLPVVLTHMP